MDKDNTKGTLAVLIIWVILITIWLAKTHKDQDNISRQGEYLVFTTAKQIQDLDLELDKKISDLIWESQVKVLGRDSIKNFSSAEIIELLLDYLGLEVRTEIQKELIIKTKGEWANLKRELSILKKRKNLQ